MASAQIEREGPPAPAEARGRRILHLSEPQPTARCSRQRESQQRRANVSRKFVSKVRREVIAEREKESTKP